MTIKRMIELLEIEHECMLRGAHDDCDRNCADCELVQDDGELHEMYTNVIGMLKEQEWISVKDRLPNCNGCYLVWRPHFYTEKGMPSICYFDGQNTWHDSYGVDFTRMLSPKDVSHWMPLPEQPKER